MDEPWVWAIIALVAVVLFGGKRLPDAARGIGRSLRIFKAETKGLLTDEEPAAHAQIPAAAPVYAPPVQQAPPAPAAAPVYAAPVQQAPAAAPAPAEQPVPEHRDAQ